MRKVDMNMGMPVITPKYRRRAITDIIESVALEQAALAHILNAEGEKIQRVVGLSGVSPDQLLDINRSVQKTLNAVTKLEVILQLKLDLFEDCLCPLFLTSDSAENQE